jgi:membrane protease YdiL (CAAX protease family)
LTDTNAPSRLALVGLWALFAAVATAAQRFVPELFGWDQVDYAALAKSTESLIQNLLVPLLLATLLVVVVVSVLGWWRPVMVDDEAVPRWMLAIPVIVIVVSLGAADWGRLGDLGVGYVAALIGATLVVGFNEEVMTRGILLTGFRRLGSETSAWAWSTALFALMHGVNLFTGATLSAVLPQVFATFLMGTLFYTTRRATGGLVVPIITHALWDFSVLSHGTSKAAVIPGSEALFQSVQAVLPLILFIVVMLAHKTWMNSDEPATV